MKASAAQIVGEEDAFQEPETPAGDKFDALAGWIMERVEAWRQWRDSNYSDDWDRYERLWRGIWSDKDQMRKSERAKVITPALSEAVESAVAEIEEAVFGRGDEFFDVELDSAAVDPAIWQPEQAAILPVQGPTPMPGQMPAQGPAPMPGPMPMQGPMPGQMPMPMQGPMPGPPPAETLAKAVQRLRQSLKADLERTDFSTAVSDVVLYSAVFGTGFGEIVMAESTVRVPTADGLTTMERGLTVPRLLALSPRNVLVDPGARTIDDGLGVAVEEEVPVHSLKAQQKAGTLRQDVSLEPAEAPTGELDDLDLKSVYERDRVNVIRWYGLVPAKYLFPENGDGETPDGGTEEMVEAIVVIVNKSTVAKAKTNPAPNGDRPVVFFPWDAVPGRLYGRGIAEKGAVSQLVLDAEVRARLDGLALTWAPIVGIDATRMPRGFEFSITPGMTVFTNGRPSEIMEPLKIGSLDPNHWENARALQAMVYQATGSMDASALASNVGDARSGAASMVMAPIIKRYKRTLVRFTDLFLLPALQKIVSRSQQAMPQRYPPVPVAVKSTTTMGIMQREYETAQLTQLLSSLQPGTAEHTAVLLGVISNTSIPNRETLMRLIGSAANRAAAQAQQAMSPQMAQAQAMAAELELRERQAKIAKLEAEAEKTALEAKLLPAQAQLEAMATATKGIYALPEQQQKAEFDRRMAMADRVMEVEKLKEKARDRASNERIAATQMAISAKEKEADRKTKERLAILNALKKGQQ